MKSTKKKPALKKTAKLKDLTPKKTPKGGLFKW